MGGSIIGYGAIETEDSPFMADNGPGGKGHATIIAMNKGK